MPTCYLIWAGLALVFLPLASLGLWLETLPAAPTAFSPLPVPRTETDAMLATLKPPKSARPLVVGVGLNNATETTDYLVPMGILRRAQKPVEVVHDALQSIGARYGQATAHMVAIQLEYPRSGAGS